MSVYNLEARFSARSAAETLDESLAEKMWELFVAISRFWTSETKISEMKSEFLVFLSNRIEVKSSYKDEYINAAAVIDELTVELGAEEGYKKLLTDPAANIAPPTTRIARARQLVSNEFVVLFLALGGFQATGAGALNYPGYFGGANFADRTPYRKYEDKI